MKRPGSVILVFCELSIHKVEADYVIPEFWRQGKAKANFVIQVLL